MTHEMIVSYSNIQSGRIVLKELQGHCTVPVITGPNRGSRGAKKSFLQNEGGDGKILSARRATYSPYKRAI